MVEQVWRKPAGRADDAAPDRDAPDDDEARIVAAAQRDPDAFAPLYERYRPLVLGYCYRRTGSLEQAEDLTQQVFIRALRALPGYQPRPGASFRAWLFTIAHNLVIDSRRRTRDHRSLDRDDREPIPDRARLPEEHAIVEERRQHVRRALARLPERQRQVVELRLAGLSGAEIAASLEMTISAVKSAQLRAFARLRTLIDHPEQDDAI